jgi:hypothetical protein
MSERTQSVLDGSTFIVGDRLGDVRADEGREQGFFSDDTRYPGAQLDVIVLGNNDQSTVDAISDSLAGMVFSAAA